MAAFLLGGGLNRPVDVVVVSGGEITLSLAVRFGVSRLPPATKNAKKLEITSTGITRVVRRLVLVGKLNGTPEKDICEVAKGK